MVKSECENFTEDKDLLLLDDWGEKHLLESLDAWVLCYDCTLSVLLFVSDG